MLAAGDEIPPQVLQRYAREGGKPVRIAAKNHPYKLTVAPLLDFDQGLVRHDCERIRVCFEDILKGME